MVWHNCQGYLCKQCLHRHCLRSPGDWATEIATNLLDCERVRVYVNVVDVRDYFLSVTDPRHNDKLSNFKQCFRKVVQLRLSTVKVNMTFLKYEVGRTRD